MAEKPVRRSYRTAGVSFDCSSGATARTSSVCEPPATVPDRISVAFTDATVRIPGCPLAMVRRYPLPSGELFHGLAAANGPSLAPAATSITTPR